MRALIIATAVLAGCAELPGFDDNVCGNGVVDIGSDSPLRLSEDCDNGTTNCTACQLSCTDDKGCEGLPGDYHCGADGLCYAPSGMFRQDTEPFPFFVGEGGVADIDNDGIGDVVGFSDITIDVRFGNPQADLSTQVLALLPYSGTNIALRTYAAGQTDILVPTPDGLVAYKASDKRLVSYPFANSAAGMAGICATMSGMADPITSFEIDKHRFGFVARHRITGQASIVVIDLVTGECKPEPLCGISVPDQNAPPTARGTIFIDRYVTQPETATSPLVAMIAVDVAPPQPDPMQPALGKACVTRFDGTPGNFTFTTLNPTAPLSVMPFPVVWARATATAVCPTLFTGRLTGVDSYAPLGTASTCGLALSPVAMPGFGGGTLPVSRIALQPPIAGRGPDALVTISANGPFAGTSDIYSLAGTATSSMYHSLRALFPVLSADLDGDGTIEGVAASTQGGQPQPDVDVLYRTAIDTFITYRITTEDIPTHITVGDFDGNALADIAYTERVGGRERLMVAYSTRDRPLPASEVASFLNIISFVRVDVADTIEPTGKVLDDLLIADEIIPMQAPELTILHGNPQRSMLAYFDPRQLLAAVKSSFVKALPGNFEPSSDAVDVALLELVPPQPPNTPEAVKIYLAKGDGSERLGEALGPYDTNIGGTSCPATAPLCTVEAEYLRWPLPSGRDVVIAADGTRGPPSEPTRHLVTIDPMRRTGNLVEVQPSSVVLDQRAGIFRMWAADTDGDQRPNLFVTAGGVNFGMNTIFGTPDEQVLDCEVDDQGRVQQCTSLASEIEGMQDWECEFAETGLVSPRGRFDTQSDVPPDKRPADVLALCKNGPLGHVFRLERVGATYRATKVIERASTYEFISIGDLNGDHLDDLSGIEFDPVTHTPIVHVHLQCAARDVPCRSAAERVLQ